MAKPTKWYRLFYRLRAGQPLEKGDAYEDFDTAEEFGVELRDYYKYKEVYIENEKGERVATLAPKQ